MRPVCSCSVDDVGGDVEQLRGTSTVVVRCEVCVFLQAVDVRLL